MQILCARKCWTTTKTTLSYCIQVLHVGIKDSTNDDDDDWGDRIYRNGSKDFRKIIF